MASSFVEFNHKGFWAKDGFIEAFMLLLFEEIQVKYQGQSDWLNWYKKELALQSLPIIYGGMSMRLDETIITNDRREVILQLIENIQAKINTDSGYISGDHLNASRKTIRQYLIEIKEFSWTEKEIEAQVKDGTYGKEVPLEYYKRGFDLLRALVAGELAFEVDTEITYWKF